jgi:tRNA (adenine37-N6)-methyltransferase
MYQRTAEDHGMPGNDATRPGEVVVVQPSPADAQLYFIGRIHTPFVTRADCPRQGAPDGPVCRIEVFAPWHDALVGLDAYPTIEVLYWMHQARRDLILQSPKSNGQTTGTFALRSPVRPNPIATSLVALINIERGSLFVSGLDCLDGTPLLDLKPYRCLYTPPAPPKA